MSTLIAPLTLRIQALFIQAATASDDVEQGLINPPLKNLLQQLRDDFRNQQLHLLIVPASPELLPLLLDALPKDALSSLLPGSNPLLYSLIPDHYPGVPWNDEPLRDSPPARPIRWIHHYSPRLFSQPVCLHVLSDPGTILKSPVLLGELAGCADLTWWISRAGTSTSAAAERFKAVPWYAEAMTEFVLTPSPESALGLEGIENFAAAFRDKLNALLSSPRYDGYLLIAAARQCGLDRFPGAVLPTLARYKQRGATHWRPQEVAHA